jgi:uncharacterized protein (TIGR02118 family)
LRALACVADAVWVAAREQDDIAATHVLDVRVAVDPKHKFALFNDVQGADIGEADRESPLGRVRNDPFSAQTDAPEQLREQVVRLAIYAEAERGVLERWRIGKLWPRSEQIGWRRMTSRAGEAGQDKPTKISFVYSNPADPAAFEAAYPEQLALARKLPGLTRLQTSKVWPKEDGSPAPAYRLLDLYFADYSMASDAAAEAGALVGATLEHATGGVVIAFAEVLDDA